MKLKSIHIHGFKSFAERVNIQYHNGITGVIGPNGSGKSNIIDAVRWVMGEQTAKSLRADDPTDIIFSGSQNRKPLSLAEVTLVFANDGMHCPAEYIHLPEISIGRRITRGGEREYFMNREPCRLKDIVEFLLSIGLGSKSYAIIQQDKRDRIIQASSEELREILEETAGITVFKVRRKEAQKRLESTAERLKNLGEIETELSRQKESLTEQVEKASQKINYSQELKESEILLIKNHIGFYRGVATKIKYEISHRTNEILQYSIQAGEWEANANDLKSEQLELTSQIKATQNALDDERIALTKYKERSDNQKHRHEERITQKERLVKELAEEKINLQKEEGKKDLLQIELQKSEKDLQKIDGELETINNELSEISEIIEEERLRSEEMRAEMRAIESSRSSLRIRNETILDTVTKYNNQLQKISENFINLTLSRGQIAADKKSLEESLNKISLGLKEVVHNRNTIESELESIKNSLLISQEERDKAKQSHLEASSYITSLEKLIASNAGFSDGTIALKQNIQNKITGFLFEHVSLHKNDESIMERCFPHIFQAALIENIDNFIEILDKIEELSIAKVSLFVKDLILPLSDLEKEIKNSLSALHGIRCVGEHLEKCTWPAARNIFDRIFICQDEWLMIKAKKLCQNAQHFVFVTERGTVLQNTNELSGGSEASNFSQGILKRKREYEEYLSLKETLQEQLAKTEGQFFNLQEKKKKLEEKNSELSRLLEKETVESIKLSNALENFDLQIKHADENIKRIDDEKKQINIGIEEEKSTFSKNQNQLDSLDNDYTELQSEFEKFEQVYNTKKEFRDELVRSHQNKKSQRAVISERQMIGRTHYEELNSHLKRFQQKVDSCIAQIDEIKNQINNEENVVQNLHREIEHVQKNVGQLEGKLEFLDNEESEVSEKLRVIEHKLKSQKDSTAAKQKFVNEKELELARCETILETALKDAFEKYSLSLEELPTDGENDPATRAKLEIKIKTLEHALVELGPVNERAFEEFKEVQTRLEFLTQQKDDIEKSVQELYLSIEKIEENTKIRFKEIFDKVNIQFKEIFPVLFPGGYGELHMLNEEELLTTGVEILIRLPGKKMQNMSLFSGGEKALTAISLIFSLLKTTPAPFCFLDEVDAPLDEANVGRFNAVLEALSDEFQFVVITHNRRTMEVLDTIYGISMHEPGISKLVSVDLSEVPSHLRKKQKIPNRVGASVVENV